jgi:hypothetical protein
VKALVAGIGTLDLHYFAQLLHKMDSEVEVHIKSDSLPGQERVGAKT